MLRLNDFRAVNGILNINKVNVEGNDVAIGKSLWLLLEKNFFVTRRIASYLSKKKSPFESFFS